MISEITPAQNTDTTSNPQDISSSTGASDAGSFQQSANADVLSQNHELTVVQTGKPLDFAPVSKTSAALTVMIAILGAVLLIAAAGLLVRWLQKQPIVPEELEPEIITDPKVVKAVNKPKAKPKLTKAKSKKKQAQTKRKK